MLPPDDHDWRQRLPPTAGPDGPTLESTDGGARRDTIERPRPTAAERQRCPVCEFASADADDVYAHLMTAHRKSTISAALLER